MSEAVAESQTATAEPAVKHAETSNGANDNPAEAAASDEKHETEAKKDSNGVKREASDEDDFERYSKENSERRNRDDRKGRDYDDRKGRDYDNQKRRNYNDRNDHGRGRGRGGFRGRGGGRGGGRGRGGHHNDSYRKGNNVRTKFERKEESSDTTEIRRQIEFYFSDSNLPIDKYLLEETGGHENKPFPLKTIHNFKRMRHFQPFSAIVEAVKNSDFLVVNDKDEVSRKEPLSKKFTNDPFKNQELLTNHTMRSSIYAKGFGEEKESTAFDIEEFFQPYGAVSVRLRRQGDGTFKGSVFVEFPDEEQAKQFLEMEDKPKFNDNELKIMSKQKYVEDKSLDILEGRVIPKSPTHRSYGGGERRGGRGRGNYRERDGDRSGSDKRKRDGDDDDIDSDNWRERRDRFQSYDRDNKRGRHSRDSPVRDPEMRRESESESKKDGEDATMKDVKVEEDSKTEEKKAEPETTEADKSEKVDASKPETVEAVKAEKAEPDATEAVKEEKVEPKATEAVKEEKVAE